MIEHCPSQLLALLRLHPYVYHNARGRCTQHGMKVAEIEVLAQCLEHGNGHESRRGMGIGTQAHGMTGSQAPSHDSQGAMGSRDQGREERQGHDREHQEHKC